MTSSLFNCQVPVYDAAAELWSLFYTGYHSWCDNAVDVTCSPVIYRGNVNGTIYHAVSTIKGLQGIGGPYAHDAPVLHCGEGGNPGCPALSLGDNSMHPYGPINGSWYALLGGGGGGTDVFLAAAPALAGPWRVLKALSFLDTKPPYQPVYVENPVVNEVPAALGGGYMCLVDLGDVTGFAISYSANGLDWTPQLREVPVPGDVRTPLGLAELGGFPPGNPRSNGSGSGSGGSGGGNLTLSLVYTFSDDHRPFAWGPALPRSGVYEGIFIVDVLLSRL